MKIISGDGATNFAIMMGFTQQNLSTPASELMYEQWVNASCQPNYFTNVYNQSTSCPPYMPMPAPPTGAKHVPNADVSKFNHDTIGMIVCSCLLVG